MAILIVFLFTLAYTLSNFWFQDSVPDFSVMVLAVLPYNHHQEH